MGQNQTKTAGPNTLAKRAKRAAKHEREATKKQAKQQKSDKKGKKKRQGECVCVRMGVRVCACVFE
jgi:hypothetical protein